jgi:hypothetical protein
VAAQAIRITHGAPLRDYPSLWATA